MIYHLLTEAFVIFITGLSVVFIFLLVLTGLTLVLTRLLPATSQSTTPPLQAPCVGTTSLTQIQKAAVVAAVQQYRANH